ncbi:hypothetical protein DFH09DRAFT_1280534 [Mycena vulgaris]|nr:hypothetical protein DFH09DRAFT_1280534 [Mycena vulgaris]
MVQSISNITTAATAALVMRILDFKQENSFDLTSGARCLDFTPVQMVKAIPGLETQELLNPAVPTGPWNIIETSSFGALTAWEQNPSSVLSNAPITMEESSPDDKRQQFWVVPVYSRPNEAQLQVEVAAWILCATAASRRLDWDELFRYGRVFFFYSLVGGVSETVLISQHYVDHPRGLAQRSGAETEFHRRRLECTESGKPQEPTTSRMMDDHENHGGQHIISDFTRMNKFQLVSGGCTDFTTVHTYQSPGDFQEWFLTGGPDTFQIVNNTCNTFLTYTGAGSGITLGSQATTRSTATSSWIVALADPNSPVGPWNIIDASTNAAPTAYDRYRNSVNPLQPPLVNCVVMSREQMGYGKTGIKTGIKTGGIGGRSADFEFYVVPCSVAPFLLERGALASPLHRAALPFPVQLCPSWDTHQHAPANKDVGISRQFKLPE